MTAKDEGPPAAATDSEAAGAPSNDRQQNAPGPATAGVPDAAMAPSLPHTELTSTATPKMTNSKNLAVAGAASSGNSPRNSREPSPNRPQARRPGGIPVVQPKRSRTHSHDVSPVRNSSNTSQTPAAPSAASIQRALSAANAPSLPPQEGQDTAKAGRSRRGSVQNSSGESTPSWPVSPRLKSPAPSVSRPRKNSVPSNVPRQQNKEQPTRPRPATTASAPNIVVQSSTPPTATPPPSTSRQQPRNDVGNSDSEDQAPLTMKTSPRTTGGVTTNLETVQESSVPSTPATEIENSILTDNSQRNSDDDRNTGSITKLTEDLSSSRSLKAAESGSESGGNKSDGRASPQETRKPASTPRAPLAQSKASYTSLASARGKTGPDAGTKNMTVETETVPSVPQAGLGAQADRTDQQGSLRVKTSHETIRAKKDKKKAARKAPSINSTTVSSKADVFEQKVNTTMGEANSSDSDETFVYESNPPEPPPRPARHHSRTPSATSTASIADHRVGNRSLNAVLEGNRGVAGKRSMKFASNAYNTQSPDKEPGERPDGSQRSGTLRVSGGGSAQHHHIGRHGRSSATHTPIHDNDSPVPQSARSLAPGSRHSSRPTSPRFPNQSLRTARSISKMNGEHSAFDLEGEGADDEHTPLLSIGRAHRTRTPRRSNGPSLRQMEHYHRRNGQSWLRKFAGCIIITIMVCLLVFGAVAFLFATTKPLYDVKVRQIQNVLASEQEIMLDLLVEAVNPNVISVSVGYMDVNVFAKSKHVGTDKWWREHGGRIDVLSEREARRAERRAGRAAERRPGGNLPALHARGIDEGNDPIEGDLQTMLLGRIKQFDSALYFDGSPLKRVPHSSVGEVRLENPGNKTEAGGTARWERVIQFPFELIVRGVLQYELPLSSHKHTASIGASVVVHPEKGIDKKGRMFVESVEEYERRAREEADHVEGRPGWRLW